MVVGVLLLRARQPASLLDSALSLDVFRRHLKTHFLRNIDETYLANWRFFMTVCYINLHCTYIAA